MNRQEEIYEKASQYSDGIIMKEDAMMCKAAYEQGAQWADKTMIEKACKWLEENITNDPTRGLMAKYGRCVTRGELLRDFKQAMEE